MFSPIRNTKVYEQVIRQINGMVEMGTLKKGDKLPSERDLVEQLQISRASVREALRALEVIGLIECRHGEGNFIKTSFQENLLEPLSILFMLEGNKPDELWELRMMMEVEAAGLAAKNRTEDQLKDLEDLTQQFAYSADESVNAEIDKKFHYKIAEYSGNILIFNILCSVSSLVDRFIKDARKSILTRQENRNLLFAQHHAIYRSLAMKDTAAARKAMRDHLDFAIRFHADPKNQESP